MSSYKTNPGFSWNGLEKEKAELISATLAYKNAFQACDQYCKSIGWSSISSTIEAYKDAEKYNDHPLIKKSGLASLRLKNAQKTLIQDHGMNWAVVRRVWAVLLVDDLGREKEIILCDRAVETEKRKRK